MSSKNIFGRSLDGAITSDDILGKDVFDSTGKFIGIAEKVFIDPINLSFLGIAVDKGFTRKGLTIGKGYIKNITSDAVMLNISVAFEMKGMEVFDNEGKSLGKVKSVNLRKNKNELISIEVSPGSLRKNIIIEKDDIQTIEENIILSIGKKELDLKNSELSNKDKSPKSSSIQN